MNKTRDIKKEAEKLLSGMCWSLEDVAKHMKI